MDYGTLESIASKCLQSNLLNKDFEILWHAGEPLLAGIEFYEKAVELIKKYKPTDKNLRLTIQTNATLIDDNWCKFFIDNNFDVGVSIDGPEFIHNHNRKNWSGKGSFNEVMRGISMLREYKIDICVICVLTKYSLDYPNEIFDFLCENKVRWVGFNVDEIENWNISSSLKEGNDDVSRETANKYGLFFSTLYDNWRKNSKKIVIREFDHLLDMIHIKFSNPSYRRIPDETKDLAIITIQKNGDITTSSPELAGGVSKEYNNFTIGNINTINNLDEVQNNATYLRMKDDIKVGVENCARGCEYFDFCGGGFVSNKYYENKSLHSTQTTACVLHRQKLSSVVLQKLTEESDKRKYNIMQGKIT
jgi:uncharacterized protein